MPVMDRIMYRAGFQPFPLQEEDSVSEGKTQNKPHVGL